jgi:leucyl aminopeptidase
MKVSFTKIAPPSKGVVVVAVAAAVAGKGKKKDAAGAPKLGAAARDIDKQAGGAVSRAIAAAPFDGKREKVVSLLSPGNGRFARIVIVGLGDVAAMDEAAAERVGAVIYDAVAKDAAATVILEDVGDAKISSGAVAAHIAGGARLKAYRFDKYRTKQDKDAQSKLKTLEIQCDKPAKANEAHAVVTAIVDGALFTRDLVNEPANVLYPASFADRAKALGKDGVIVEVLDEAQLRKLGMGALVGVGQGSARPPRVLVMRWNGARNKSAAPLALIGKGVCFDTGGISLKPPGGMWDMKWDMGGAAVVTGVMLALARRKAKANVVGLCGLVENMPDGNAQRPGDVVTSMSGQTIEVQNTDAEGRLVLADVLWYAQQRFKPKAIIDLATLTGAIIAALADHYAGLFSNNDELSEKLTAAGKTVGERLWRLPMGDEYDRELKSLIADMKNIGGARAGSITAAQFLQRFVDKDTPWAHLDIAGVVWNEKGTPLSVGGATSYGVRLLNRLIADNYES